MITWLKQHPTIAVAITGIGFSLMWHSATYLVSPIVKGNSNA